MCFTFKSNLNIKCLNVYLNKKLISSCIIYEINKYIYRNLICMDVDCKNHSRPGKA